MYALTTSRGRPRRAICCSASICCCDEANAATPSLLHPRLQLLEPVENDAVLGIAAGERETDDDRLALRVFPDIERTLARWRQVEEVARERRGGSVTERRRRCVDRERHED